MSIVDRALAELERPAPTLPSGPLQDPPAEPRDRRRGLIKLPPLRHVPEPVLSIDEARAHIRAEMDAYLAMTNPTHMLLIALPPGSGKTTEAVRQVERWAQDLRGRVLYAGPRHELWDDLMRESTIPADARDYWWYHWQPHTAGDPETGQGMTCRFARPFAEWTARGHVGFQFCRKGNVCGRDNYINERCVWHRQKRQTQPIVFVQHADLILGHPFLKTAGLVVGDESPLSAFLRDWRIPARAIIPPTVFPGEDGEPPELALSSEAIELLRRLRDLVDRTPPGTPPYAWEGPELLAQLGGAEHVRDVCDAEVFALGDLEAPRLRGGPDGVDSVPYNHLVDLLQLLLREAREAADGADYVRRVRVTPGGLQLLLRRRQDLLSRQVTRHVIWLDATANTDLYRLMFDRDVHVVAPRVQMAGRVYQVHASLNNRDTLIGEDVPAPAPNKRGKPRSSKRQDVRDQVDQLVRAHGHQRPAVITYKPLTAHFSPYETAHFGNLRGSNRMRECDSLMLVGTPQAPLNELRDQAAMLHQQRMRPFDTSWSEEIRRYGALPWGYAASGFYGEPALHALLLQNREAELVQAAHRVRPLFRPVSVYLLTNLPLPDLPPDELLSLNDVYDAPPGVDAARWPLVEALAARLGGRMTAADLMSDPALQLPERTARRWIEALRGHQGWAVTDQERPGRGRPVRVAVRTFAPDFRPRVNK